MHLGRSGLRGRELVSFPIMSTFEEKRSRKPLRTEIPLAMIAPHENQAHLNHRQTLQRLAERGGLSACEAVAVLEDRRWQWMDLDVARARLEELVLAWERR